MATTSLDGDESLIKFPAAISVKAMGLNEAGFESLIVDIVTPHLTPASPTKVVTTLSSQEKYMSVRVHFTALNQAQIERIYVALRDEPRVKFTL